MTQFVDCAVPPLEPSATRMCNGTEVFRHLWHHFLRHPPLRNWLMCTASYGSAAMTPSSIAQGIAFCCNFSVPDQWADLAPAFELGEMFIPDHPVGNFMCGTVVAATPFHKHIVCALRHRALRTPKAMPSYKTSLRRMVVDMGTSRSVNLIEFSWMQDGSLIVTAKILVPPDPSVPYQSAGCTGAFALYRGVAVGGELPTKPCMLVGFVELPRCPFCVARGSLSCYCTGSVAARGNRTGAQYSSAVLPPRIEQDIEGTSIDSYHSIRSRLALIQHVAQVKITPLMVSIQKGDDTVRSDTIRLTATEYKVRAVRFRPCTASESDVIRQVADQLRLLGAGLLQSYAFVANQSRAATIVENQGVAKLPTSPHEEGGTVDQQACSLAERETVIEDDVTSSPTSPAQGSHDTFPRSFPPLSPVSTCTDVVCTLCGKSSSEVVLGGSCTCRNSDKRSTSGISLATSPLLMQPRLDLPTLEVPKKVKQKFVQPRRIDVRPEPKLQCSKCEKTFSQQGSLNRHLKNIHDCRKIPCEFCRMPFGQAYDLRRHQRRKHADKYPANHRPERVMIRKPRIRPAQTAW